MARSLRVMFVVAADDEVVAGPFQTNAEAWRAVDRLAGEPLNPAEKRTQWITDRILREARD